MLPATCAKEAACLPGKGLEALAGQGAAATPAVFNAYQQAQNALDAQMAAANPGLYTVRSTGALPTYTL